MTTEDELRHELEYIRDTFVFKTSNVDVNVPFEKAYLSVINRAISSGKMLDLSSDTSIIERFGSYQNGTKEWKRLTTKVPCHIDVAVEFMMCG